MGGRIVQEVDVKVPFVVGKRLGITVITQARGLVVTKVVSGARAHGKLLIGDTITRLNGDVLREFQDLVRMLGNIPRDCQVVFTLWRRTRLLRFIGDDNEKLLKEPKDGCDYFLIQVNCSSESEEFSGYVGLSLAELNGMMIVTGVEIDSPVGEGRVRVLDRLFAFNNKLVNSLQDFNKILARSRGILEILVERPLSDPMKHLHLKALCPEK